MIDIAGSSTATYLDNADEDQSSLDESYESNQRQQEEDQLQIYN